ncbi:hypothetical protein QN277_003347 [Acacia crassicarpa]|uniref:Uncharacterized protein n=1 Tax=Acacia crassicarpa TaxID=499986 RepID=A0AAE1MHB0_9FABA|nr:hypothetical protein QN277_003347 [Acacia crassicarpa]
MANKKVNKQKNLGWYMKAPVRLLSKVRDAYVNGMNRLNPHVSSMDAGFSCRSVLPRSFSVGAAASWSASDDFRELVRASSVSHRHSGGLDLSVYQKQIGPPSQPPAKVSEMAVPRIGVGMPSQAPPAKVCEREVPRSRSVGIRMARINEDESCEFDDHLKTMPLDQARSRSYSVGRSTAVNYSESNVRT